MSARVARRRLSSLLEPRPRGKLCRGHFSLPGWSYFNKYVLRGPVYVSSGPVYFFGWSCSLAGRRDDDDDDDGRTMSTTPMMMMMSTTTVMTVMTMATTTIVTMVMMTTTFFLSRVARRQQVQASPRAHYAKRNVVTDTRRCVCGNVVTDTRRRKRARARETPKPRRYTGRLPWRKEEEEEDEEDREYENRPNGV